MSVDNVVSDAAKRFDSLSVFQQLEVVQEMIGDGCKQKDWSLVSAGLTSLGLVCDRVAVLEMHGDSAQGAGVGV